MCELRDHPEYLRMAREGQIRHRVNVGGYLIVSLNQGRSRNLVVYADGRYQLTGEGWDSIAENLGAIYLDGHPREIEFCDQDVAQIRQQPLPATPPLPPEIPPPVKSEEQALEHFVRTYPRQAKRETYPEWESGRLAAANNNPALKAALKGMRITQTMLREASRRVRKKSATVP
jgi:hypothetical protein